MVFVHSEIASFHRVSIEIYEKTQLIRCKIAMRRRYQIKKKNWNTWNQETRELDTIFFSLVKKKENIDTIWSETKNCSVSCKLVLLQLNSPLFEVDFN